MIKKSGFTLAERGAGRTPLQKVPVARFGMEQANGEHLLDGAVYQNCEEFDPRYITAERKNRNTTYFKESHHDEAISAPTNKRCAFTLAEILITLAVIGIVAASAIGIFLPTIHKVVRARQMANAEIVLTKATEHMALDNAIGAYYNSTMEFVNELQKYLRVVKVCENNNFEECFGYDKFKLENNDEFDLSDITSGANFGKDENYLETVGLVTINGTGMILSWNKNCPTLETKEYMWADNTNETTSCITGLFDVNLNATPNRISKDMMLFRAETLTSGGD